MGGKEDFMDILQNIFSSGETDPLLAARADKPFYQHGAARMENMLPVPMGGVTRRPGTRHLGTALSATGRLIPFVFSASETRMLEFGNGKMRVWNADGSPVMSGASPYEISTPFSDEQIRSATFAQSADVMWFACSGLAPRKLSRYGDTDWRWSVPTFGCSIAAPTWSYVEIVGSTESTLEPTYHYYVITSVDAETGQESLPSLSIAAVAKPISTTYYPRLHFIGVQGALCYRVYKKRAGAWACLGRTSDNYFDDQNITPDAYSNPPEAYPNHFGSAGNYPRHVFFFQQRLGFASTDNNPLRIWLSRTGEFEDFSYRLQSQDDDAIEITLASTQSGVIQWVAPDRNVLVFATQSEEWTLQPSSGQALTPSNGYFTREGSDGAAATAPVGLSDGILYLRRGGRSLAGIGYRYDTDRYVGQDLSILSRHLLRPSPVVSMAWQKEPYSILWASCEDGKMLGLTLMKDQEVCGWHRHSTRGAVKWLAVLPDSPDDRLWLLVQRTEGSFVEMLEKFPGRGEAPRFLDCATLQGGTSLVSSVSGLGRFAGEEVCVWADGGSLGPAGWTSATVGADGTAQLGGSMQGPLLAGIPFASVLCFNPPEAALDTGSTVLRRRRLTGAMFRVRDSMAFQAGTLKGPEWEDGVLESAEAGDREPASGGIPLAPDRRESRDVRIPLHAEGECVRPFVKSEGPAPFTLLAASFQIK